MALAKTYMTFEILLPDQGFYVTGLWARGRQSRAPETSRSTAACAYHRFWPCSVTIPISFLLCKVLFAARGFSLELKHGLCGEKGV